MTTIIYDHKNKQIAIDGRRTGDGVILNDNDVKYLFTCDQAWFFCGMVGDHLKLLDAFNGKQVKICESNAFLVIDKQVFRVGVHQGKFWKEKIDFSDAMGSGCRFAISALDFGKTAKQCVEYAMTRDYYTGGKVTVYNIESGELL